ncbi:MAG: septum formation inhibitor Maf [Deltaproteobacteria bacterium]|nr:septum formation inhibitor Maf [Deltaproteobacteria bacterium]
MIRFPLRTLVFCVLALGCQDASTDGPAETSSSNDAYEGRLPTPESFSEEYPEFDRYWYQGRAELTRYALRQARYGDQHDGEAVLVFVTEDFLPGPQVKQEHGESPDAISVLKLNAYRRFYTGIYPYTLMTSSFTPALEPRGPTLKLSSTIQEWCGHVYSQINRRDDGLHAVSHSYFQDDADQKTTLPAARLEDGIWAQIRIDPSAIPIGKQALVPALDYIRMRHKGLRAYPAEVTRKSDLKTDLVDHPVSAVEVKYPALGRDLIIYYEPKFPHVIQAWEENVGPQRTTAVRSRAIVDDYWKHNGASDGWYRDALGLTH